MTLGSIDDAARKIVQGLDESFSIYPQIDACLKKYPEEYRDEIRQAALDQINDLC